MLTLGGVEKCQQRVSANHRGGGRGQKGGKFWSTLIANGNDPLLYFLVEALFPTGHACRDTYTRVYYIFISIS